MKLYTFGFDLNGHILGKWKPFWVKQKGFQIENNDPDTLEQFSLPKNA
jgi:hypothetical protein